MASFQNKKVTVCISPSNTFHLYIHFLFSYRDKKRRSIVCSSQTLKQSIPSDLLRGSQSTFRFGLVGKLLLNEEECWFSVGLVMKAQHREPLDLKFQEHQVGELSNCVEGFRKYLHILKSVLNHYLNVAMRNESIFGPCKFPSCSNWPQSNSNLCDGGKTNPQSIFVIINIWCSVEDHKRRINYLTFYDCFSVKRLKTIFIKSENLCVLANVAAVKWCSLLPEKADIVCFGSEPKDTEN